VTKNISPIHFIDKLVRKNELGQPFSLTDHQREILRLAFAFDDDDRLSYDTIIYSCPKKSGKTTINGALTLWWAFTQEAPNEILVLANDLEQSLARVFKTMEGIIDHNPQLKLEAEVQSKNIYLLTAQRLAQLVATMPAPRVPTMDSCRTMSSGPIPASRAGDSGKN
jgi:phage terminase large subunit-like protein